MAASVLYFGPDQWNRVQVLESAGYTVRTCLKIADLESELRKSPVPAVVVVNSFARVSLKPAVDLVHAQVASAHIIAFPGSGETGFEKFVDLVVPPLTPPEEWLKDMAALLERTRVLMQQAISVHEQTQTLLRQLSDVRAQAAETRAESAAAREKSAAARANCASLSDREKTKASRRVAGSTRPGFDEKTY